MPVKYSDFSLKSMVYLNVSHMYILYGVKITSLLRCTRSLYPFSITPSITFVVLSPYYILPPHKKVLIAIWRTSMFDIQ